MLFRSGTAIARIMLTAHRTLMNFLNFFILVCSFLSSIVALFSDGPQIKHRRPSTEPAHWNHPIFCPLAAGDFLRHTLQAIFVPSLHVTIVRNKMQPSFAQKLAEARYGVSASFNPISYPFASLQRLSFLLWSTSCVHYPA